MDFLNQLLALIPDGSAPWIASVAIGLEFVLRIIPSQKPLSVLHAVGGAIRLVGNIFVKAADLLDKVLPQNVKKS